MTTAMWSLGLKARRSFCSVKDKDASTWQVLILWATMQPQTCQPTNGNIQIYTIYLTIRVYIYIYMKNICLTTFPHISYRIIMDRHIKSPFSPSNQFNLMFAYTCTLLQVQYTCSNMCRRLQGVLVVLASGCIRKSPSTLCELRGFIEKWQKSVLRRFLESWFSGIRAVSPSNQLAKHGNIVRLLKTDTGYHNLR